MQLINCSRDVKILKAFKELVRQHRIICFATRHDILSAKKSLPIKNMPDPL